MASVIVLDTGPLSNCVMIICGSGAARPSERCRQWLEDCESAGALVLVPATAYYEVLREIERRHAAVQRQRLIEYCFQPDRFIPLTTAHLEAAAQLCAQSRNSGSPTSNQEALDGDAILCAQAQSLGLSAAEYILATTNTMHLTQFVPAADWQSITI